MNEELPETNEKSVASLVTGNYIVLRRMEKLLERMEEAQWYTKITVVPGYTPAWIERIFRWFRA